MERRVGPGGAPRPEPILNVPAGVVWAIAILIAVHVALGQLPTMPRGPDEWTMPASCRAELGIPSNRVGEVKAASRHEWWQLALAFIPARYRANPPACVWTSAGVFEDPPGAAAWSFITHQLVHADWAHLAINCAWLLAFGGAIASRVGMARFALLGFASGIAGALLFLAFRWGEPTPMAGASGAVSGLMGAAFRFFFSAMDLGGLHRFREAPWLVPRLSLLETLKDRRIQMTIGFFVVINFVTALGAHYITSAGGIAWEAHLGGFFFGLLAFALFDPPPPRLAHLEPEPGEETRPPTLH